MGERDVAGILRVQQQLARFAREFSAEVVHSHDVALVMWMYQRGARQDKAPLVVTLHNVMSRRSESALPAITKVLREATWTTGVSQAVVDDMLSYAPFVAATSSVIRNGIEPLAREPSTPDGRLRFACIGRLQPQKGFDLAVRAFAAVRATHPGALLVIAGDGPERSRLTQLAAEIGVSDGVEFLGEIDRGGVARVLSDSTVVVIPSHYEGLPLVALEAAFAGRPVIATDAPGLSEAVVRGKTALVVPPDDPDALAAAMAELVGDPRRVRTMGRQAREIAEARYSLNRCVDAYERLYAEVVQNELATRQDEVRVH